MSEPMTRIQARYMSGDQVALVPCPTINDVRVRIARRHNKFAPDVTVLSSDYRIVFTDDDAAPPLEVAIVISEELYDDARWHAAVIAHAKAQDAHGVRCAMEKVERCGHGSGAVFCGKVLCHLVDGKGTIDIQCVSVFIECGADVNYVDGVAGATALTRSAEGGHAEVVQMLISAAADINHACIGQTALSLSAERNHAEVTQVLIAAAANINYACESGFSALSWSAAAGSTEVAQVLISAAANINHTCAVGGTALMLAADKGHAETAQTLVAAAADINLADEQNLTALWKCVSEGHVEIAQMLISAAADVNYADEVQRTALWICAAGGYVETLQLLISAAADINYADAHKCTALMVAAQNGHTEIVQILTNAQNHSHWLPIAIAQHVIWLSQTCSGADSKSAQKK